MFSMIDEYIYFMLTGNAAREHLNKIQYICYNLSSISYPRFIPNFWYSCSFLSNWKFNVQFETVVLALTRMLRNVLFVAVYQIDIKNYVIEIGE